MPRVIQPSLTQALKNRCFPNYELVDDRHRMEQHF